MKNDTLDLVFIVICAAVLFFVFLSGLGIGQLSGFKDGLKTGSEFVIKTAERK